MRLWLYALALALPDADDGAGEIKLPGLRLAGKSPERPSGAAHRHHRVEAVAINHDKSDKSDALSHDLYSIEPCRNIDAKLAQNKRDRLVPVLQPVEIERSIF